MTIAALLVCGNTIETHTNTTLAQHGEIKVRSVALAGATSQQPWLRSLRSYVRR